MIGNAKPDTTTIEVKKRPRSTGPELSPYSSEPQWANRAFGRGASTNVRATSRGSQLCQRAQERIIKRNPTASTNDSRMTVLRPAAIVSKQYTRWETLGDVLTVGKGIGPCLT